MRRQQGEEGKESRESEEQWTSTAEKRAKSEETAERGGQRCERIE